MFSTMHLIILAISFTLIAVLSVFVVKKKVPYDKMLSVMVVVTIVCELIRVFGRIEVENGVARLPLEFLPLHLCSIEIFVIWYLKFFCRNEAARKTILAFMYPTCLAGGLAALLIVTVIPFEPSNFLVYEYYLFHVMSVVFGLYIPLTRQVDLTWKRLVKTCAALLVLFFLSIFANSMFGQGAGNFFYSSRPPLAGLPYLNFKFFGRALENEKLGWLWYLAKVLFLGVVSAVACYAPFLIKRRRPAKAKASSADADRQKKVTETTEK